MSPRTFFGQGFILGHPARFGGVLAVVWDGCGLGALAHFYVMRGLRDLRWKVSGFGWTWPCDCPS